MLDAHAIFRLLIDDEQPVPPKPDDPNQLDLGFDPDALLDPKAEVMRYAEEPFRVPGSGPTNLYAKLEAKLGARPRRKVGNNTYIIRSGGAGEDERVSIAVRFHQTDVVTAYPDGKVVVETGGWRPGGGQAAYGWRREPGTTTRARINDWLPSGWGIYQQKGEWFWANYANRRGTYNDDMLLPYSDGDTIFPDGSLRIQEHPVYVKRRKRKV